MTTNETTPTVDMPTEPGVWRRTFPTNMLIEVVQYETALMYHCGNEMDSLDALEKGDWEQLVPSGEVERLRAENATLKQLREQYDAECIRLAEANAELRRQLEIHQKDLADAAGDLLVDIPHPDSVAAKLLRANRIMRRERDIAQTELATLRQQLEDAQRVAGQAKAMAEANTMLRKIAAHVPGRVWIKAKEDAGHGTEIKAQITDPKADEAWLEFVGTRPAQTGGE
jgi:hypothetical protein